MCMHIDRQTDRFFCLLQVRVLSNILKYKHDSLSQGEFTSALCDITKGQTPERTECFNVRCL